MLTQAAPVHQSEDHAALCSPTQRPRVSNLPIRPLFEPSAAVLGTLRGVHTSKLSAHLCGEFFYALGTGGSQDSICATCSGCASRACGSIGSRRVAAQTMWGGRSRIRPRRLPLGRMRLAHDTDARGDRDSGDSSSDEDQNCDRHRSRTRRRFRRMSPHHFWILTSEPRVSRS